MSDKRPSVRRRKYSCEELLLASSALGEDARQLRIRLPIASEWKAPEVHARFKELRARCLRLSRDIDRAGLNVEQFRPSMLLAVCSLDAIRRWLSDYRTLQQALLNIGKRVDALAQRVAVAPLKALWYRHRRFKALRHEWDILLTLARAMGAVVVDQIQAIAEKFSYLDNHFRHVPSKGHTWNVISRLGLTTTDLQVLGFSILTCKCTYCYYSCNPAVLRQDDKAVEDQLFDEISACPCKLCETTRKGLLLFGTSFLGTTKAKRRWASEILTRLGRNEHNN